MDANTIDTTVDYSNREVLAKMVHAETVSFLSKLDAIWDEMGIEGELRGHRGNLVLTHITDLFKDILTEAEEYKSALCEKITTLLKELSHLERELQMNIPINRYDNIPLCTVNKGLEEQLHKYQNIYAARKTEISELQTREKTLSDILGIPSKPLTASPLPDEAKLVKYRTYIDELTKEKSRRDEKFNTIKILIIDIMAELNIKPSLDFEKTVIYGDVKDFKVTEANMRLLDELHKSLETQLADAKVKIQDLREKINTLWVRLEESPEKRSAFLAAHPGNSVQTLKALKKEVSRCEELKKANIKIFIDKMRRELEYWWVKCRCAHVQTQKFIHFHSNCYTEDLLTLHEMEVDKLKNHYEKNREIYELVTQREELWEKMLELQHRAEQPDRFKNRGGQLLMEEKERKAVASKLPKIEHKLLELVEQYETETAQALLINGELVCDMITNAWEAHKENKHIQLSAKKQARENTIRTPRKTPMKTPLRTPLKSPMAPNNMRLTPHVSSAVKRKLGTPAFGSTKRSKSGEGKPKPPTLKLNDRTIKRASTEKRKKMARKRKSWAKQAHNMSIASTASDYDNFEMGLEDKNGCRSTLFTDKQTATATVPAAPSTMTASAATSKVVSPCSTPRVRNPLKPVTNTPVRTPGHHKLRTKSPAVNIPHRAPTPGNIPIIM